MKLSSLKELIAEIESNVTPGNPDPDVSFWVHRVERLRDAGPDDSQCFVNFEIDVTQEITEHRVTHNVTQVMHRYGDFCIPLAVAPFFDRTV